MTTAPPGSTPARRGVSVIVPVLATAAIGVCCVLLAALTTGAPGVWGAAIAAGMVCLFFATGAVVLGVVARVAPGLSLLIALLTYTLKIVLIGLVFVALTSSGALESAIDRRWLGGTVIACTLVWISTQIVVSMRTRMPVFDLPPGSEEPSVR